MEPCDIEDDDTENNCVEVNGQCRPDQCGTGVQGDGDYEDCDDGNEDETDGCRNNCLVAFCGDGVVQAGEEQCDDMNTDDTDSCIMDVSEPGAVGDAADGCKWAECGDGYWYKHETDNQAPNEVEACENTLTWDQICGDECEIQCLSGRPWAGTYPDNSGACYFVAEELSSVDPGECYPVVGNWVEARDACRAYNVNADLAIITESGENSHIEDLLMACATDLADADQDGYPPVGGDPHWWYGQRDRANAWLGARDLSFDTGAPDPDGDWYWINGTAMSWDDWYGPNPDDCCLPDGEVDVDLSGQQQCLSIRVGTSPGWRDWDCYWGWETAEDRPDDADPTPYPHFPQWAVCEVAME
jgi:cysteine-rich repeat protein